MDSEFSAELARRRNELLKSLQGGVIVLFSAPVHLRNGDVEHSYRQDSDFFYLTGLSEPECALILGEECGLILFVRERNREKETWEGRRIGVEGAVEQFGAKAAHPVGELSGRLADYMEDKPQVHYLIGQDPEWDQKIIGALTAIRGRRRKRVTPPGIVVDARLALHEMRLLKSPYEQRKMFEVAALAARAHQLGMEACKAGMAEWELQNIIESEFKRQGAQRLAYDSIVGSGDNATILHYRENNCLMAAGDLVLVDAGAEKDHYASDITRTYPVSGKFSDVQARLYQAVLDAQTAAIAGTVVGATIEQVHDAAWEVLKNAIECEGLIDEDDRASEEKTRKRVNRFYMHRTSHYLGMDVHDVGPYHHGKEPRLLEAGVVVTVEPGLYFAPDDETVPQSYRGIGIRIEDDVLVTAEGPVVLSEGVPKRIDEIEALSRH